MRGLWIVLWAEVADDSNKPAPEPWWVRKSTEPIDVWRYFMLRRSAGFSSRTIGVPILLPRREGADADAAVGMRGEAYQLRRLVDVGKLGVGLNFPIKGQSGEDVIQNLTTEWPTWIPDLAKVAHRADRLSGWSLGVLEAIWGMTQSDDMWEWWQRQANEGRAEWQARTGEWGLRITIRLSGKERRRLGRRARGLEKKANALTRESGYWAVPIVIDPAGTAYYLGAEPAEVGDEVHLRTAPVPEHPSIRLAEVGALLTEAPYLRLTPSPVHNGLLELTTWFLDALVSGSWGLAHAEKLASHRSAFTAEGVLPSAFSRWLGYDCESAEPGSAINVVYCFGLYGLALLDIAEMVRASAAVGCCPDCGRYQELAPRQHRGRRCDDCRRRRERARKRAWWARCTAGTYAGARDFSRESELSPH